MDSRMKATLAHNNYRADPELQREGQNKVIAARRLACACAGCRAHLQLPIANRYKPHDDCAWAAIFEAYGACAGARPAQPGREPEKQGCMCDEFVRRRWLSISQGFIPILATCMSFKKWVHAVQFDRGEPARAAVRKSCRISFHTGMQHVRTGFRRRFVFGFSLGSFSLQSLVFWSTV